MNNPNISLNERHSILPMEFKLIQPNPFVKHFLLACEYFTNDELILITDWLAEWFSGNIETIFSTEHIFSDVDFSSVFNNDIEFLKMYAKQYEYEKKVILSKMYREPQPDILICNHTGISTFFNTVLQNQTIRNNSFFQIMKVFPLTTPDLTLIKIPQFKPDENKEFRKLCHSFKLKFPTTQYVVEQENGSINKEDIYNHFYYTYSNHYQDRKFFLEDFDLMK